MVTRLSYLRRKGFITTSEHHLRIVEMALFMCLISCCDMKSTTWRQAKTKHVTTPEAIIFFIVEMPGILHSAKGLLSQRAECSSCICPDIAS